MDTKAWPQEAIEWALQSATPANEKLDLNVPLPKVKRTKKNITAYEKHGEAGTWCDPMEDTKPTPTIQDINETFDEVEMVLGFVRRTLGYLDQALNIVDQKLGAIQNALSARESLTNQEYILPHSDTLYNSIPRGAEGNAVTEEENRELGNPYNPVIDREYLDDEPETGDSLHWRFSPESHGFREERDGNGRRIRAVRSPTWGGLLRKESVDDSLGYAADDEISPPLAKVFEK